MKSSLFGLLLLPGLAAAQAAQPYTINGQVDARLNAPAKAYLFYGNNPIDSAALHSGRFTLRGQVGAPSKATVLLSRRGSLHDGDESHFLHADLLYGLYLEPGLTTLTSPDSLKHARIVGGPLTTDWQALQTANRPFLQQSQQLQAEYDAASPAQRQTPEFRQARALRRATIHKGFNRIDSVFVVAHPASVVSLDQLNLISNTKADSATARHLFALLTPALRQSPKGQTVAKKLAAFRQPAPRVGTPAPDFTLTNPEGQPVALRSYRGQYVLVDFWASWCKPCRAENPNVVRAYEAFKAKSFTVLSVSIDAPDHRASWLKAVHDDQLPWAQVLDQDGSASVAKQYQVESIPQNFLLDPSGRIVAKDLRGEALQAALKQYLPQ